LRSQADELRIEEENLEKGKVIKLFGEECKKIQTEKIRKF